MSGIYNHLWIYYQKNARDGKEIHFLTLENALNQSARLDEDKEVLFHSSLCDCFDDNSYDIESEIKPLRKYGSMSLARRIRRKATGRGNASGLPYEHEIREIERKELTHNMKVEDFAMAYYQRKKNEDPLKAVRFPDGSYTSDDCSGSGYWDLYDTPIK